MRTSSQAARVSGDELDRLEKHLGRWLPLGYRHWLAAHGTQSLVIRNGHRVRFWTPATIATAHEAQVRFPDLLRFGDDGDRGQLAFDYQTNPPRVVLFDIAATDDADIVKQGSSFDDFLLRALESGRRFEGQDNDRWRAMEVEADADIAAGRATVVDGVGELIAHLDAP
jgi:hypothetical protein